MNWLRTLLKDLWCLVFKHRYEVARQHSQVRYKLHCRQCGRYFAMDTNMRTILPWDQEFEDMYRELDEWAARERRR